MPLMIRNPRAADLARTLATRRKQTMTDVVIVALENELKRDADQRPLTDRLKAISDKFLAESEPTGTQVTKADLDQMWGHD